MKIGLYTQNERTVLGDILAVPIFENEAANEEIKLLNELTGASLVDVIGTDEMKGKPSDVALIHLAGKLAVKRLLLLGAGKRSEFTLRQLRQLAGKAARIALQKGIKSLAIWVRGGLDVYGSASAATEGTLLGLYDPALYRKKEDNTVIDSLTLYMPACPANEIEAGIAEGKVLGEAANFTRYLAVEPANKMTPKILARHANDVSERCGLECTILGPDEMQKLGMEALLGVAAGSDEPAQLIVMHYKPKNISSTNKVALVGKGITFDSGGLCIKPSDNMWEMKYDMSGGATVIGAMQVIGQIKPNVEVYGLIAAAENLPSGKSYKPGDVVKSYIGKTIEVVDTDAEGRLVLADAIGYARHLGATHIVDIATLTGAVTIALGLECAGLMGNNTEWISAVKQASKDAGEKLWELPLDEEYKEKINSDIADLKNYGGRYAGSITAGYFLKEFAEDTPWAHLDIAGTAWLNEERPEMAKGPSGFGVRTLAILVKSIGS